MRIKLMEEKTCISWLVCEWYVCLTADICYATSVMVSSHVLILVWFWHIWITLLLHVKIFFSFFGRFTFIFAAECIIKQYWEIWRFNSSKWEVIIKADRIRTSGRVEAGLWVQAAIKSTWSPKHDYSDWSQVHKTWRKTSCWTVRHGKSEGWFAAKLAFFPLFFNGGIYNMIYSQCFRIQLKSNYSHNSFLVHCTQFSSVTDAIWFFFKKEKGHI